MGDFWCDRCGKGLLLEEQVRYVANLEVFAAYDTMELTAKDIEGTDHEAEIRKLLEQIAQSEPSDLQDQVHRNWRVDLCLACQQWFIDFVRAEFPGLQQRSSVSPGEGAESDEQGPPNEDDPVP